jgi:GNAT superfamily N-acetyltransferase
MSLEGPRFIRPAEFDNLIELLGLCFSMPNLASIPADYPHVFADFEQHLENFIVIADHGRIVSHVGVAPAQWLVHGNTFQAAGITFVGTHPDYRGQGLMQRCLELAVRQMHSQGAVLSWLIGDRQRYGHFGFENAGRKFFFQLTRRSVQSGESRATITEYQGQPELLTTLQSLHARAELRLQRSDPLARILFQRENKRTFLAWVDGIPVSYLTLMQSQDRPGEAWIFEHGGGPAGFHDLLHYCFASLGAEWLTVTAPATGDACLQVLFDQASSWRLDPGFLLFPSAAAMVKILDLKAVLTGFQAQMNRCWLAGQAGGYQFAPKGLSLQMEGDFAPVQLIFNEKVEVIAADPSASQHLPVDETLTLDNREMVRLLFGVSKPSVTFSTPTWLDQVFPLDFFVSALEDI